ncbi:hypothetical protein WME94_22045 [Sorangium sp. So ce429]
MQRHKAVPHARGIALFPALRYAVVTPACVVAAVAAAFLYRALTGNPAWSFQWRDLIRGLRGSHRCVALDYPGFGLSEALGRPHRPRAGLPRLAGKEALIFWALRDVGVPRGDLERFEAAFPEHRTIELPDADHFFFEDAAEQMIQEIRAFAAPDAARPTTGPGDRR